ncbi:MAG: Eco29kI family restriction endonuclease [Bacteroidota bacterium]
MEQVIKDTIRFFNGTPVLKLPPLIKFHGTGVYAIYYTGGSDVYKLLSQKNKVEFSAPIYVGKAVPRGWRQARIETDSGKKSYELHRRLQEHARSIRYAKNLLEEDFRCRFIILEDTASSLIGTVEAALIRYHKPIWNTEIDGFGNHDPGKGRYNQAKSEWDVIHPGRPWADKCLGAAPNGNEVEEKIAAYFTKWNNR